MGGWDGLFQDQEATWSMWLWLTVSNHGAQKVLRDWRKSFQGKGGLMGVELMVCILETSVSQRPYQANQTRAAR